MSCCTLILWPAHNPYQPFDIVRKTVDVMCISRSAGGGLRSAVEMR